MYGSDGHQQGPSASYHLQRVVNTAEYGGLCTFCGAQVALSYGEQSQVNAPPTPSLQSSAKPPQTPAPPQPTPSVSAPNAQASNEEESKQADAIAFKNRLVGYDRNAAQRTKVIDDQSDYFEIDSNTWLSKQVCSCHWLYLALSL